MIRGRDRYESLSHQGGPREGAPVRFGRFVVPAAVAWVLEPIGRSPSVRAEFEMRRGKPACVLLSIAARSPGEPVTTADLEGLPGLDRKAADAYKALAIQAFDDDDWRAGKNIGQAGPFRDRPGRDPVATGRTREIYRTEQRAVGQSLRERPDDELQEVAAIYRANVKGQPVEAVMEALDYSRSTADRRIRAARERGFLPRTTRGKRKA